MQSHWAARNDDGDSHDHDDDASGGHNHWAARDDDGDSHDHDDDASGGHKQSSVDCLFSP